MVQEFVHPQEVLQVLVEMRSPLLVKRLFLIARQHLWIFETMGLRGTFEMAGFLVRVYGCGSKPMVPLFFWARCTTHFSLF